MGVPIITTDRLILEPLELGDAEAIQTHLPHWEIVRYLSKAIPWPYPENGARDYLENICLPAIAKGRMWSWSLRRKQAPDELMGVIDLMDGPSVNRAFWLASQWQGKGYMTEAALAVTDFWFDVLGKDIMRTSKACANTSSSSISQRTGMRLVGHSHSSFLIGDNIKTECWELTREEWQAMRR